MGAIIKMNKVFLEGNITMDAKVTHHEDGQIFAQWAVATVDTYNDKRTGNKVTNTEFHNCYAKDSIAQAAEYAIKKGRAVVIEGAIEHVKKNDGRVYDSVRVTYFKATNRIQRDSGLPLSPEQEMEQQAEFAKTMNKDT